MSVQGLLVGPQTTDELTLEFIKCEYVAQTLLTGGTPSPNVLVNNSPLVFYSNDSVASPVTPVDKNPLLPPPCPALGRKIIATANTTVFINGKLPALSQDKCIIIGGTQPRDLRTPFVSDTIRIGTNIA